MQSTLTKKRTAVIQKIIQARLSISEIQAVTQKARQILKRRQNA
jgi:hypothetical protein